MNEGFESELQELGHKYKNKIILVYTHLGVSAIDWHVDAGIMLI